jgi:PAS domain S-box-containing protein
MRTQKVAVTREQLSLFLRMTPDPAWVIRGASIAECNGAGLHMMGYKEARDVLHKHPASLAPPLQLDFGNSRDRFDHYLNQAQVHGSEKFEWVLQDRKGTEVVADVHLVSVVLPDGEAFYCTLHDITQHKQLERELQSSNKRFRLLFDMAPEPLWLIRGNVFIDCNRAAVTVLGYRSKTELLHKHPSELSPAVQPDGESSFSKANRMGRIAWEKGLHHFEWVHLRADASQLLTEVTLTPIELDTGPAVYCAWRDFRPLKR